jgi:hypothetical protein
MTSSERQIKLMDRAFKYGIVNFKVGTITLVCCQILRCPEISMGQIELCPVMYEQS